MTTKSDRRARGRRLAATAAGLVFSAVALLAANPGVARAGGQPQSNYLEPKTPSSLEQKLINETIGYINQERSARGLAIPTYNSHEQEWAQAHSRKMAAENCGDGTGQSCHDTGGDWRQEYNPQSEAVTGAPRTGSAVAGLMRSGPHRDILMASDITWMAVGVACFSNGSVFVTVHTDDPDATAGHPAAPAPAGPAVVNDSQGSSCASSPPSTSPPATQPPATTKPPASTPPTSPPATTKPPTGGQRTPTTAPQGSGGVMAPAPGSSTTTTTVAGVAPGETATPTALDTEVTEITPTSVAGIDESQPVAETRYDGSRISLLLPGTVALLVVAGGLFVLRRTQLRRLTA